MSSLEWETILGNLRPQIPESHIIPIMQIERAITALIEIQASPQLEVRVILRGRVIRNCIPGHLVSREFKGFFCSRHRTA